MSHWIIPLTKCCDVCCMNLLSFNKSFEQLRTILDTTETQDSFHKWKCWNPRLERMVMKKKSYREMENSLRMMIRPVMCVFDWSSAVVYDWLLGVCGKLLLWVLITGLSFQCWRSSDFSWMLLSLQRERASPYRSAASPRLLSAVCEQIVNEV